MLDVPALLQPLKDRLEGLADLCPEHLGQGIRHLQRNCDIECSVHQDDAEWDACKQPDRYSGDRMAHALSESAKLIAAIEEVSNLHEHRTGEYRDMHGQCWIGDYCLECRDEWPCDTITNLTQALGGDTA